MANAPGVRFEESPEQVLVSPASATLAGFVGSTKRGRVDEAVLVSGWADYVEKFGGFSDGYSLAVSLWDYFRNGGGVARILRVVASDAVQSDGDLAQSNAVTNCLKARAADPGEWGNELVIDILRTSKGVTAVGGDVAQTTGKSGVALPGAAGASEDVKGTVLTSVRGLQVGDICTGYDADGVDIDHSNFLILDIDATHKEIRYKTLASAENAQDLVANGSVKTASRHLVKTAAAERLLHGGKTLVVKSAEGIERGSLLSMFIYSDLQDSETDAQNQSMAKVAEGVVDKVVGNTIHFVDNLSATNNVDIPAAYPATVWLIGAGDGLNAGSKVKIQANATGPAGNDIVVTFSAGAALGVTVTGNTISVKSPADSDADALVDAINDDDAASALVTASVEAGGNQDVNFANTVTLSLRGGADLQVVSQEFDLAIKENGVEVEVGRHTGLSIESTSKNFVGTRLGGVQNATTGFYEPGNSSRSRRLILDAADGIGVSTVAKMPVAAEGLSLTSGADGATPSDSEMVGQASPRKGVHLFSAHDDVDFLCAPGRTTTSFMRDMIEYAEDRGNLLLLLDAPQDKLNADDLATFRTSQLGLDSTFAALYAPWGKITDPRPTVPRGSIIEVPPTPAVAGLIAQRVDRDGVHHSAANQSPNWVGVKVNFDESDHAALNEDSVNVIRIVRRSGLRLYGSRTLTSKQDGRRFTNVRRFINYIKQSLAAQLQPLTFNPVNESLFTDITHLVTQLLVSEWQRGALYPQSSMSKAFVVKCDGETTSATDMANGVVNCVVALSPTVPAEQIVFRLNVSTGGIQVEEA